jgi:hypothetical protein
MYDIELIAGDLQATYTGALPSEYYLTDTFTQGATISTGAQLPIQTSTMRTPLGKHEKAEDFVRYSTSIKNNVRCDA